MTGTITLVCWKCRQQVNDILLPFSRAELCIHCRAELHVCKQCQFYDPSKASACREPIADHVTDKTRANFCGYFVSNNELALTNSAATTSTDPLNALFGIDNANAGLSPSSAHEAQSALDDLFGLGDDDKKS